MIIDPQNPNKAEIREWQKRTTQFQTVYPEFTVEADQQGYTVTMLSGEIFTRENAGAPYTNYQCGVLRGIQEGEKTTEVEVEEAVLEEVAA